MFFKKKKTSSSKSYVGSSNLKGKLGFRSKDLVILAVAFAGIGGYFIYRSFAATGKVTKWEENSAVRPNENNAPGLKAKDCTDRSAICHANGKLVKLSKTQTVWESDPRDNGEVDVRKTGDGRIAVYNKEGNFTWFGPYIRLKQGDHKTCFRVKDLTPGKVAANVYYDVTGDAGTYIWKRTALAGNPLPAAAKKNFVDMCLSYDIADGMAGSGGKENIHNTDLYRKGEYRLKVISPANAVVQIDYVNTTEYQQGQPN